MGKLKAIKANKKIIAESYSLCNSLFSKFFGLMFSSKKNLIFVFGKEKRVSLHMFFVFFPIWVVYLNKDKEVIFTKKLYPFISITNPKVKPKYILELVKNPKIKKGDKISW